MTKLFVRKYHKEGMDGDRASKLTPYYDYHVVLQEPNSGTEATLQVISGHDSWWSHHLKLAEVDKQLQDYLIEIIKVLGIPPIYEEYKKQQVVKEDWVKIK